MKKERQKGYKNKKSTTQEYSLQRYLLVGGGLGLYIGWFFRPAREPNVMIAVGLSLVAAIGILIFALFRKERPPFQELLKKFPLNIIQYFLILLVFEARHYAYDWGGRGAVVLLTCVSGCAIGYWMMIRREQFS